MPAKMDLSSVHSEHKLMSTENFQVERFDLIEWWWYKKYFILNHVEYYYYYNYVIKQKMFSESSEI